MPQNSLSDWPRIPNADHKPADPAFVVYLNTINELESEGKKESLSDADRQQIIEAIKAYFSGRGMVVDFE